MQYNYIGLVSSSTDVGANPSAAPIITVPSRTMFGGGVGEL